MKARRPREDSGAAASASAHSSAAPSSRPVGTEASNLKLSDAAMLEQESIVIDFSPTHFHVVWQKLGEK